MRKSITVLAALLLWAAASAQDAEFVGKFHKGLREGSQTKVEAMQGMSVHGNTIFSAQNAGILTIYKYNGRSFKELSQFRIASADKLNHCNVLCMGLEKAKKSDRYPVIYISLCNRKPYNGMKDVCFVERIMPDRKSSELVQTINFEDTGKLFGYAVQWVIDPDEKLLVGFGNTLENKAEGNLHRIVAFKLPKLLEGSMVTLTDKDLVYNYLVEESYTGWTLPISQGLCIRDGLLYMPTGFGKPEEPSLLYVWDLKARKMAKVMDLTRSTASELEDCDFWHGHLLVQSQDGLWKLKD